MREDRNLACLHPERFLLADDLFLFGIIERSPALALARVALDDEAQGGARCTSPLGELLRPHWVSPPENLGSRPEADPRLRDAILKALETAGVLSRAGVIDLYRLELMGPGTASLARALDAPSRKPRGLQGVLAAACLPIEPKDPHTPLTSAEARVARAVGWLDWMLAAAPIPRPDELPRLSAARRLMRGHRGLGELARCHVVAVQHVLATNLTLFRALAEDGLQPARTEVIGVPYSTNYVVEFGFERDGIRIHTPDLLDPMNIDAQVEREAGRAIDRALRRPGQDPILIIDDGGKATCAAVRAFPEAAARFRVVEQTTRGITELSRLGDLAFPVVDVARAPLKRHEVGSLGREVVRAVERLTQVLGMQVVRGRSVGVLGYGVIGESVARAFVEAGARVSIWDLSAESRSRAAAHGFEVPATREQLLADKALLIGASGHRSISKEDLPQLAHECVVGSASSRDVEIDLTPNHDPATENVPILSGGRADTRYVTRVWRFPDKDVVLLQNGLPLNFNGDFETGTAASIEQTRAIMYLGVLQALTSAKPGLQALDLEAQRCFAHAAGVAWPAERPGSGLHR